MKTTSQKLPKGIFRIDYTFDYNELQPEVARILFNLRAPGFRPGHVPMAVVNKIYGENAIYYQLCEKMVGDTWKTVVSEANAKLAGQGNISMEPVKKNEPFVFHYDFPTEPEFVLGEYKDLKVFAPKTEVTDKMVEDEIRRQLLKQVSRTNITDRPCNTGDVVRVDFVGTIDGEAFDGGSANDTTIKLGAGRYLQDLETAIVGMTIGEERDCPAHFPDNYYSEPMRGKNAVFHVTLKDITEETVPELDDDFVQDVSEFDTVDEYRAGVRKTLEEECASKDEEALRNRIFQEIFDRSTLDVNEAFVRQQAETIVENEAKSFERQGVDYDAVLEANGYTREMMVIQRFPEALSQFANYYLREELIKAEGIEVTDEELAAFFESLRESVGDRYEEMMAKLTADDRENYRAQLKLDKLFEVLKGYTEITYVEPGDPRLFYAKKEDAESAEAEAEKADAEGVQAPAEPVAAESTEASAEPAAAENTEAPAEEGKE